MTEKQKPSQYIGITGFKTVKEVLQTAKNAGNIFRYKRWEYNKDSFPKIMFGFLSSNKRLDNIISEGGQSPAITRLGDLIDCAVYGSQPEECIPMIHYHTTNKQDLALEIFKIFCKIYDKCNSLQLNITWPPIGQVEKIKKDFPEMNIVLQLNKEALKDKSSDEIIQQIKEYQNLVEYILIDPSGGKGVEFDIEAGSSLIKKINEELPNKKTGIAGGFGEENVYDRVLTVARKTDLSSFCIDAQGKLRTEKREETVLDLEKTKKYIERAVSAFCEAEYF